MWSIIWFVMLVILTVLDFNREVVNPYWILIDGILLGLQVYMILDFFEKKKK